MKTAKSYVQTFAALAALTLSSICTLAANLDLSVWYAAGVAQDGLLQSDHGIQLPAGAQLFRTVSGNGVTLNLVSSPKFTSDPDNLSMVELGSTALVFVAEGDMGTVKLIQGNHAPQSLPSTWKLDATGHAAEPMKLEATYRGDSLIISAQGQVFNFEVTPLSTSLEIVLSSGTNEPWLIHDLVVTMEQPLVVESSTADQNRTGEHSWSDESNAAPASTMSAPSVSMAAGANDVTGEDTPADQVTIAKTARGTTLEVFTPPSVRHGRSVQIRSALNRTAQK